MFAPRIPNTKFSRPSPMFQWHSVLSRGMCPTPIARAPSGSTRRQAVVDSKFKLVFPKGCKHGEDIKAGETWSPKQLRALGEFRSNT